MGVSLRGWLRVHWPELALLTICITYALLALAYDQRIAVEKSADWVSYVSSSRDLANYLSPFHGPGFSVAIFLATPLFPGSRPDIPARIVSSLSAVAALMLTYALSRRVWQSRVAGLLAVLALALSAQLWTSGTWALSDMLGATLMLAGVLALWEARAGNSWAAAVAGVLTGAAYMTRYVAGWTLAGVGLCVVLTAARSWRRRASDLALLAAGALLPALPWLIRSTDLYGSPFYNLQHLNIIAKLLGYPMNASALQFQGRFPSMLSVIQYDPVLFVSGWLRSLIDLPAGLLDQAPGLTHLAILGLGVFLFDFLRGRGTRAHHLEPAALTFLAYTGLVALGQSHPRYWLPLYPFLALLGGRLIVAGKDLAQARAWLDLGRRRLPTAQVLGVAGAIAVLAGGAWTFPRMTGLVATRQALAEEPGQFVELAKCLAANSQPDDLVYSTAPHVLLLSGRRASGRPESIASSKTVEELATNLHRAGARYLVVESWLGPGSLSKIPKLFEQPPASADTFARLDPVCALTKPPAAVYRVLWVEGVAPSGSVGPVTRVGPYRLGDAIRLVGYHRRPGQIGGTMEVTLYWEAVEDVPADYQAYVHVLDAAGAMVAQHDGTPVAGHRPTSGWKRGTVIVDRHVFPAPTATGEYRLTAGMYVFDTLARLPATEDATGVRQPNDEVILETWSPTP